MEEEAEDKKKNTHGKRGMQQTISSAPEAR
jgi:hypothetical protein